MLIKKAIFVHKICDFSFHLPGRCLSLFCQVYFHSALYCLGGLLSGELTAVETTCLRRHDLPKGGVIAVNRVDLRDPAHIILHHLVNAGADFHRIDKSIRKERVRRCCPPYGFIVMALHIGPAGIEISIVPFQRDGGKLTEKVPTRLLVAGVGGNAIAGSRQKNTAHLRQADQRAFRPIGIIRGKRKRRDIAAGPFSRKHIEKACAVFDFHIFSASALRQFQRGVQYADKIVGVKKAGQIVPIHQSVAGGSHHSVKKISSGEHVGIEKGAVFVAACHNGVQCVMGNG